MIDFAIVLMWIGLGSAIGSVVSPRHLRWGIGVAACAACVSCAALGRALWTLDLSVTYVADHARSSIGRPYRLAGLWGGASGSLMMFTAMVAVVVTALSLSRRAELAHAATRWGGATVAALIATVIAFANPFGRLQIPAIEGSGLQPILEHPAMLYHPPILYAGLVSTIAPWIVALSSRRDPDWRRTVRPWLGVCLALLTLGQATGANWAYVELGWGGFWGWDPVENGVLVAWLFVLVALHSVGQAGHHRAIAWACAMPWIGVLLCTTVTRAGVGESVHAFADDTRIAFVLVAVVAATLATTTVMLWGVESAPARLRRAPFASAVLLIVGAAVVVEGMLYPLVAPNDIAVSGHFYAVVLGPVALVVLAMSSLPLPLAPRRRSRRSVDSMSAALLQSRRLLSGGAAVALAVGVGARTPFAMLTAFGVGAVVAGLVVGVTSGARGRWAMRFGHFGFAVLLIGVAGSTQGERSTVTLAPGEQVEMAGVSFTNLSVDVADGPVDRSRAVVASVRVSSGGDEEGTVLRPALVAVADRGVLLAETGLDSRPRRDVQVVLRTATDDGSARFDLSVTPLVQVVWWGSVLLVIAGAAIVFDYFRLRSRSARARSRSTAIVADSASASAAPTSSSNAASSSATDL